MFCLMKESTTYWKEPITDNQEQIHATTIAATKTRKIIIIAMVNRPKPFKRTFRIPTISTSWYLSDNPLPSEFTIIHVNTCFVNIYVQLKEYSA